MSRLSASNVDTRPSSAKLKRALYIRHTEMPRSESQLLTLQTCDSVPEDHHESSEKDTAQSNPSVAFR